MTIKGEGMSSKTIPTTRNGVLLALASLALIAGLTATGIGAQTGGGSGADREPNFHSLKGRGDIKFLPAPLQDRLVELARRPHSYLPLHGLQRGRRAQPAVRVLPARHDRIRAERIHEHRSWHQ
jgi:hypothetical protein